MRKSCGRISFSQTWIADDADNDNRIEEEEDDFADISKYGIIEIAGMLLELLLNNLFESIS